MVRILLSSTNQTKEEEEAMRFHLTTPARTYVFECETPEEVSKWMSGLKKFSENLKVSPVAHCPEGGGCCACNCVC